MASWSGVRVLGGAGWELVVGWRNGVELEPSTVVFEIAGDWLISVIRPLASFTCPMASCPRVSCSIACVVTRLWMSCRIWLYSSPSTVNSIRASIGKSINGWMVCGQH